MFRTRSRFVVAVSVALLVLGASALPAAAGDYYLSATGGSMSNPGTQASPWPNLQTVAASGRTFATGDVLILLAGHHGSPRLVTANAGFVSVRPLTGARATLKKLSFSSAARFWRVQGLEISPATAPTYTADTLVDMSGASDIIVEDCLGYSVLDAKSWTSDNWNTLPCDAVYMSGSRNIVRRNVFKNIDFGISADRPGTQNLIQWNTIDTFNGDGLRGLADYCTFEYNTVKNCVATNANHDDGFQSWTNGPGGVGTGIVRGVVLRGNMIIQYEDPNMPFRGELQGIGCFDGFFEDWVVENNVVMVDHWHGISFYGARNCKFVNNTVVDINTTGAGPAWLMVTAHKNGTPSSGNIVRNNLVSDLAIDSGAATMSNNLETTNYTAHFANWAGRDLRLKAGSSAIDGGTSTDAPVIDILQAARPFDGNGDGTPKWDIGAYEYGASGGGGGGGVTAPQISTQPASKTVTAGQTATFSVTATGTAPLIYQWQKGNSAIAGATSSSYTTPATVTGDSGTTYRVVVSNSAGSATSNSATLTVTAAGGGGTSSGGGSKDGGCGLTGLEAFLLLALLRAASRRP
jgi:hypothetical protein